MDTFKERIIDSDAGLKQGGTELRLDPLITAEIEKQLSSSGKAIFDWTKIVTSASQEYDEQRKQSMNIEKKTYTTLFEAAGLVAGSKGLGAFYKSLRKGVADIELQRRLASEAGRRVGMTGAPSAAVGTSGLLRGLLHGGSKAAMLGMGITMGAAVTGPFIAVFQSKIAELTGWIGEVTGSEIAKGTSTAFTMEALKRYTEVANFAAFLSEDVMMPAQIAVSAAIKSGNLELAEDIRSTWEVASKSLVGFSSTIRETYLEMFKQLGMEGRAEELADQMMKAYILVAETGAKAAQVGWAKQISEIERMEPLLNKLGIDYTQASAVINELTDSMGVIGSRQSYLTKQADIWRYELSLVNKEMQTMISPRFIGQAGAERGIFEAQAAPIRTQIELMEQYGAATPFGQGMAGQRIEELRGGFDVMEIQRRLLEHSKGTVMYETEAKAVMTLRKEQQKQSIDFQLTNKDDIITMNEKRNQLAEEQAIVSLLALQYQESYGRMTEEVRLNIRSVEDCYLLHKDQLYPSVRAVGVAYNTARDQAEEYTERLDGLNKEIIDLSKINMDLHASILIVTGNKQKIEDLASSYDILAEAIARVREYSPSGSSGGGSGSGDGFGGGSSGGRTWADYSDSELFAMLRAGGTGAYGAASELSTRGFTPNEDSPYRDYFHSGGFITSDRMISVQKGERVIAKEHASSGEVTLIVNNSFTSVSVSDQEVISETISDSILNKLREAKGII